MAVADMDLDGDPDLLVNWHHNEPLELYESTATATSTSGSSPAAARCARSGSAPASASRSARW
ncbi:MAG: hypothetical protein QNK04_11960 [Myxococcota bacterium]|nr:hypothetical protein [Myxococcota bacterium]